MRRLTKVASLPVLLLAAILTYCATPREGTVVRISDGDTLTVLMSGRQVKVRLAEIDAPEKRQPFGQRSKQSLSELVYGEQVQVEQQDLDRYGRVVGRVHAGGLDVNAEQIRRGMAWVYRKYNKDKELLTIKGEARRARRGLWADAHPVPPVGVQESAPLSLRCSGRSITTWVSRVPSSRPLAGGYALYQLVQEHLETFLAQVERETGSGLPEFVKDEFDAFLQCGILAACRT